MTTYSVAHSPRWTNSKKESIELIVKFDHLDIEVPFTATIDDSELHGQELFKSALIGKFGKIAEPDPVAELRRQHFDNENKMNTKMKLAIEQSQHCDMMGDSNKAISWRSYYKELYAIKSSETWPNVFEWPNEPEY